MGGWCGCGWGGGGRGWEGEGGGEGGGGGIRYGVLPCAYTDGRGRGHGRVLVHGVQAQPQRLNANRVPTDTVAGHRATNSSCKPKAAPDNLPGPCPGGLIAPHTALPHTTTPISRQVPGSPGNGTPWRWRQHANAPYTRTPFPGLACPSWRTACSSATSGNTRCHTAGCCVSCRPQTGPTTGLETLIKVRVRTPRVW